jgi:hypothetical protein
LDITWWRLYKCSITKEVRLLYPEQKRGSHLRLNFSCMGFGQTDLSWIEQGSGKDKSQKKTDLSWG